jgi:methyltransferase (TIGR00027 family)
MVLEGGHVADALLMIETGVAELCTHGRAREPIAGPGGCIGASGLLAGAASRGDVVAKTSMNILRLPADTSLSLLLELPDVERELHRIALLELSHGGPEPGCRSRLATNSAEAMAALRAAGSVDRNPELRNPDDLAASMLSLQLRAHALAKLPGARRLVPALAERLLPGGYYYETARVKHIDTILQSELDDGLGQLVLLGAGYDTRPYRFADELREVRVYEVDLPALSEIKRRKVTRLLGRAPDNVRFIQADLAVDDVRLKLGQSYDLGSPTLIILSGVTPYLAEPAVARLLDFAGQHTCPRSSLVFDYVFREMVEGDDSFHGAASIRKRLEKLGEPLRFGLAAGSVEQYVERFGLALVSDLQATGLARRYLCATDGTVLGEPYGFVAIAHTRVSPDRRRRG